MRFKHVVLALGGLSLLLGIDQSVLAQVTADSTLSTTVETVDNLNFFIEAGAIAGTNLFHSFEQFSVPTGGSVVFENAPSVEAIFSRVTGGDRSIINGELRTQGTADLFFLNPNGIVFGPNARLDLGGSFLGTTAERVIFQDGSVFSATVDPIAPALLSISVPSGLQMGSSSSDILVQGTGHTMTYPQGSFVPFERNRSSIGLQVPAGESLHLVGENLRFDSGVLTAESGRIGLGAIAAQPSTTAVPEVALIPDQAGWRLDYDNSERGRIELNERSLIDASGGGFNSGSGSIHLHAAQVELLNASTLLLQNTGTQTSGGIVVNASNSFGLSGRGSLSGQTLSEIRTESLGTGAGGNIDVLTKQLLISDGAQIATGTFGTASGGDLRIQANEHSKVRGSAMDNLPNLLNPSFVGSASVGPGQAGELSFTTGQLVLANGGFVGSLTLTEGIGGNVMVKAAESIELVGINPVTLGSSSINVSTLGSGDAGQLMVQAPVIRLLEGGKISSSTLSTGNAGRLTVIASEQILVQGQGRVGEVALPSEITSSSERVTLSEANRIALGLPLIPSGESGRVVINTPVLEIDQGGALSVRSEGIVSNAGSLEIQARDVMLANQSQITATAREGQGGDIRIEAKRLSLHDRSQINASTQFGQAGNIELQIGQDLELHQQGQILAGATQAGQGGSVNITALNTVLSQDSGISTSVQGTASGGALNFVGDRLSIYSGSNIATATLGSGQAGNAWIRAREIDVVGIANTQLSDLGVMASPSLIVAGSLPGSSGRGGNLRIDSDRIRVLNGGLITVGTLGSGDSGELQINASESLEVSGIGDLPAPFFGFPDLHPSRISASSIGTASAGSVRIQTPLLSVTNGGVVEVNGAGAGGAGNLDIVGDRILLSQQASLQAQVAGGDQGNILLKAEEGIVLQNGSRITTDAINGSSGGNIMITTPLLIGLGNSDIVANAITGNGGNVAIAAQNLLGLQFRNQQTPQSDITASSQSGLSGSVEIRNFDVDTPLVTTVLPTEVEDTQTSVATSCISNSENRFTLTGRGGLPVDPAQPLIARSLWQDSRSMLKIPAGHELTSRDLTDRDLTDHDLVRHRFTSPETRSDSAPRIEASHWRQSSTGRVELVATASAETARFSMGDCRS